MKPPANWCPDRGRRSTARLHRRNPRARHCRPRLDFSGSSREQAIEALTQGGREPCKMCRPDTALGLP
ncbi:DUF6233 domain-containing protein [Streptomyces niveus]|uniref:DUF6233 domain-containing protein n=1 Tax=Streptomyces niveus TaxID=193462 RepID=UPI0036D36007